MKNKKISLTWVLKTIPVPLIVAFLLLSAIAAFEGVLNAILFGQLANLHVNNLNRIYQFIGLALVAYLAVYTSLLFFYFVQNKIVMYLNQALKAQFFFSKFANANKDKIDTSDAVNAITSIAKEIEQKYFYSLTDGVQALFSVIASAIVVLETNLVLGIIYLLLSVLTFVPSFLGKKAMSAKTESWTETNSLLIQTMKDIFDGHTEITNFGVDKLFFKHFKRNLYNEENNYRIMNNFQFKVQYVAWLIALATLLLPIFIGLIFMQQHLFGVTIGAIITLSLSADRVVGGLRQITMYQSWAASTDSIREIQNYQFTNEQKRKQTSETNQNNILRIANLSVDYGDKPILRDINLTLMNQQKIIITGASGIGKSTFLKCIANNLSYQGKILLDGKKINNHDFINISQKVWLFKGTVRENLTLLENIPDDKLLSALKKVDLLKELGKYPLDKKIDDDGSNLSGGQTQRLALARGLVREKRIYLLDEVTSSLDKGNANTIHELIYHLPAIVIEVAHNFDSKIAAKCGVAVFRLERGKLVS